MPLKESHFYEFGPFRLEPSERRLLRGDRALTLSPKIFETLLILVENAGHAVEKGDLLRRVWPDTFVEDGSLVQNISLLRKILGDEEGTYIETVSKRGYRFVAPVTQAVPSGETLVVDEHTLTRVVTEVETSRWHPGLVRLALAVCLLCGLAGAIVYFSMRGPSPPVKSLAVLPLQNLRESAGTQLELAIADSIILKLSEIRGLTVRPTAAVRAYAEFHRDPLQAARELHVEAVLDGALQMAGDRVRVSLNLLQTSSGASLWTHVFDVSARDIFELEDEIALNVATQLRLRFDGGRPASPGPLTRNAEAYEHYLKGLYATEAPRSSGRARIDSAISRFSKAAELDPSLAQAWARLASCYYQIVNFYQPDPEIAQRAENAASRAAALAPDLPELHVFRAQVLWSWGGHFQIEEAIRELRRAAGHSSSEVHSLLGVMYSIAGLDHQSIRELKRAVEIDPSNTLYMDRLAQAYVFLGRYDEARGAYERAFAIESQADGSLHTSAIPFLYAHRFDEARLRLERFHERNPRNLTANAYLALLCALEGRFREAESAVPVDSSEMEKYREAWRAFYAYGSIYALQGKLAEALPWLRKAAAAAPNYPMFDHDPHLDRLRRAPEFLQLLAELKSRYDAMQTEFR
jgi:DNA-binding winged helix-turn-helix (wHTH) protein/TolB-like protein/Tfp pilus assembly protein PilF